MARGIVSGPLPARHSLRVVSRGGEERRLFDHPPSGVIFPERTAGFIIGHVYRYDKDGRDISARYRSDEGPWVSVYVFPSVADASAHDEAYAASIQDVLAQHENVRVHDQRAVGVLAAGARALQGHRMLASGERELDGVRDRWMCLVEQYSSARWHLKFRFSWPGALGEPLCAVADRFIASWLAPQRLRSIFEP